MRRTRKCWAVVFHLELRREDVAGIRDSRYLSVESLGPGAVSEPGGYRQIEGDPERDGLNWLQYYLYSVVVSASLLATVYFP